MQFVEACAVCHIQNTAAKTKCTVPISTEYMSLRALNARYTYFTKGALFRSRKVNSPPRRVPQLAIGTHPKFEKKYPLHWSVQRTAPRPTLMWLASRLGGQLHAAPGTSQTGAQIKVTGRRAV